MTILITCGLVVALVLVVLGWVRTEHRHAEVMDIHGTNRVILQAILDTVEAMDELSVESLKMDGELHADLKQALTTGVDRLHADNGVLNDSIQNVTYYSQVGATPARKVKLP